MTRIDLATGNFQGVGGCNNGVHVITSPVLTARFGVTVWGWGNDITWPPDFEPDGRRAEPPANAVGQLRIPPRGRTSSP